MVEARIEAIPLGDYDRLTGGMEDGIGQMGCVTAQQTLPGCR